MDNERWKSVRDWEGIYEVSSHGRIRSFDKVVRCGYGRTRVFPGRILQPVLQHGYPIVFLYDAASGRRRRVFVHVLVCEAFHGAKPAADHEVAHGDGNPANAHCSNLRWATHRENEADKKRHGTAPVGERHGRAKLDWPKVREIRAMSGSHEEIARLFGVTRRTVGRIRTGRLWQESVAA